MISELDKLGFDNSVYVPTYDANKAIIAPDENVTVSECFKKWDRVAFDYKQVKITHDIEGKFDISEFDLIHAYTLFTDGNCARRLSQKYRIPYVVAVRNTDVNDFFRKLVWLRNRGVQNMRHAERVFFLSLSYLDHVRNRYIPSKLQREILKKSDIIPNGIDEFWIKNTPNSENMGKPHSPVKLIYAGRIDRNKNIPTIQSAMDLLDKEGNKTELLVIGPVDDKKILKQIKEHDKTQYLPRVGKEELITYYRNSDIFVMPSFTESFGLVYAEAMSQNLPILYSEGQGFDQQFPEGCVGYHINPREPEDVANGIKKILNRYNEISNTNYINAKKFQWGEIAKVYLDIYNNIKRKQKHDFDKNKHTTA
jgi:glycosyltransferase involved in cell wall biosynthesis